jgi:hypothetical protein
MMRRWNKGDFIALCSLFIGILAIGVGITVPEARCWLLKRDCPTTDRNNSPIPLPERTTHQSLSPSPLETVTKSPSPFPTPSSSKTYTLPTAPEVSVNESPIIKPDQVLSNPLSPRPNAPDSSQRLQVYKARGSSVKDENENYFGAQKMLDNQVSIASFIYSWWPREGETIGAWADLYLNRACTITEVAYYLAFPKYGGGSQIRQATLHFENAGSQQIKFNYVSGWQRVHIKPQRADQLRLEVDDIFPVNDGKQLQVIEVELYGNKCDVS